MNTRRTAALFSVTAAVVAPVAIALPAVAYDAPYRVTARTTDTAVQGTTFVVRGRYRYLGELVDGGTVQLQTRRDGRWVNIKGAQVTTNSEGRYKIRVSLNQVGLRRLSVLAWQKGKQGVAVRNFSVTIVKAG